MGKTKPLNSIDVLSSFTDVLYLTNKGRMPAEIKHLLQQNRLSFLVLPINIYPQIRNQADLIGTVIIDVENLDMLQQQKLAQVIESLEVENISVILLSGLVEMPIKSFSLAPTKNSFLMIDKVKSFDINDLWARISLNLAYRKKSVGITVKPAVPANQVKTNCRSRLEEQLQMDGTMVDNLTEQLRMAGLVQRDFLPTQLPNCDKVQWAAIFLPAEWVSGDIYDIVRLDEEHIGFYVADAVGHSMPAALLTIFIKQALVMRETIENNYRIFSPVEVIKNLNLRISDQKLSGYQFATCCYGLLNIKTLQLTYARAGHPYPIIIKAGKQPEQLELRGLLLGVFEEAEYIQHTIQLEPGDKLLLYSDGAESFVGDFDDLTGYRFSKELCDPAFLGMPIVEMMDRFHKLMQNRKVERMEIDDITVVGMQIL